MFFEIHPSVPPADFFLATGRENGRFDEHHSHRHPMGIKQWIFAQASQAITSEKRLQHRRRESERRRIQSGAPHRTVFYHRVDDPYSFLLLQALPAFRKRFGIEIEPVVVLLDMQEALYPAPELLEQYALVDAERLARYYDMPFPHLQVTPGREMALLASRALLSRAGADLDFMIAVTEAFWKADDRSLLELTEGSQLPGVDEARLQLASNQRRLEKSGHYLSGMLHYGGEWYWGLDRLGHLERRLLDLWLSGESSCIFYSRHHRGFLEKPVSRRPPADTCLDFFFSFRSPYSYLAVERTFQLVDRFGIQLQIRPVLPMVMRGMKVPRLKRMYIVQDAKREALSAGVPFGRICDPVGSGAERCLALFRHAAEKGKERDFILSAARGAWSEGIDLATDKGLKQCVERIGLDWNQCRPLLGDESWREMAEKNRQEMFSLGSWGVPTFRLADTVTWGQDRLWVLEDRLRRLADE